MILSKKLLNHWLLFVEGMYILLQSDISIEELDRAAELLHKFVAKSQEYFGGQAMSYNLHQLQHISRSVLDFIPLWAHSTFSFESANYYLLKAIHSAKGVPQQIVRFVYINHSAILVHECVYAVADEVVKIFCDEVLSVKTKNIIKIDCITYFGEGSRPDRILKSNKILAYS